MGKASRDKGKRGERLLAAELREAFPEYAQDIRRGWQSRAGDDEPDVLGVPGLWFEHKFGAKPNPRAALAQAIGDADGQLPVAVVRDNRKEPFAVLRLCDLFKLIRNGRVITRLDVATEASHGVREGCRRRDVSRAGKSRWVVRVRQGVGQ